MKKWEYIIKVCREDALSLYDLLDKMTNEGWEVCSHCWAGGGFSFIFKREKKDA